MVQYEAFYTIIEWKSAVSSSYKNPFCALVANFKLSIYILNSQYTILNAISGQTKYKKTVEVEQLRQIKSSICAQSSTAFYLSENKIVV